MNSSQISNNTPSTGSKGYILINRDIKEHWLYTQEREYSRWEAFESLLMSANYADAEVLLGGEIIQLKRGERIHSQDKLAKLWGWSRPRVKRFLKLLENEREIELKTCSRYSIISIIKYDTYTEVRSASVTTNVTTNVHQALHREINKNKYNNLSIPTDVVSPSASPPGVVEENQDQEEPPSSKLTLVGVTEVVLKKVQKTKPPKKPIPEGYHPSPSAPNYVDRKPEELVPIDPAERVWMTRTEYRKLVDDYGQWCAFYLCEQMSANLKANTGKWAKQNRDHFATWISWYQFKTSKGIFFFDHPERGMGFYPEYVIKPFGMVS